MNKISLNLKLLNSFEVSVVIMIVVGFFILGLICISSLSPKQQSAVASGLDIFDIHQQIASVSGTVSFIAEVPAEFMNQFYIAFTEVAVLPDDVMNTAADLVNGFSSTVSDLRTNLLAHLSFKAEVASASTSLYDQYHGDTNQIYFPPAPKVPVVEKPYEYVAPNFRELISKVDWKEMK